MIDAFVSVPGALADQISETPACESLRLTSVQVSPAPVTVARWAAAPLGPSSATNATSCSPAVGRRQPGAVSVPCARLDHACRSMIVAGGGAVLSTLTATGRGADVPGGVCGLRRDRVRSLRRGARVPLRLNGGAVYRRAEPLAVDLELDARSRRRCRRRSRRSGEAGQGRAAWPDRSTGPAAAWCRGAGAAAATRRRAPRRRRSSTGGWSARCRRWHDRARRSGSSRPATGPRTCRRAPVSTHWWRGSGPPPRVRATAPSQSLPTPKTTSPARSWSAPLRRTGAAPTAPTHRRRRRPRTRRR